MAPKNRAEYRKIVAEAFAGILSEKGLNWREEWDVANTAPENAVTGKRYHGVNQFYLSLIAMMRGYADPRWATMTQIMDKNGIYHKGEKWHLQAGSKAVFVEYWYPYDKLERKQLTWREFRAIPADERADDRYMLRVRYTPVFHASMIDGIPELKTTYREPQQLSDIVTRLSASMGIEILNDGGNRAFYRLNEDKIHLPLSTAFHGEYEYNATALHELAHSTGHPSRLNRPMSGRFGSEEYAFEELIAEISSCFMSVNLDVQQMPQHMENHKAYVQEWVKAINDKPDMLMQAIAQAQRTATYMDYHAGLITEQQYNASLFNAATQAEDKDVGPAPEAAQTAEENSVTQLPNFPEETTETRSAATDHAPEVFGAYESDNAGVKTWPLETEHGVVNDFRDYVQKSERALGGNVIVTMPDDANEYVTQLITEGKIRIGDAAYIATNAILRNGTWEQTMSSEYQPGPHGESYLATPDAAGMKSLLIERFPDRDFELWKDVDSKHVLLTEQMKALGYEPTTVDGFSDDFLMWRNTATGKEFGVDGWDGVQAFIEDRADLASYVGKKVTWDGEEYDVEAVRDNRLSLKNPVTGHYREPTLSEFREHGAVVSEELTSNENTFSIYQLRHDLDSDLRHEISFESFERLAAHGRSVELANYDCVYTGGELNDGVTLDDIWEKFNIDRPDDFTGHSLSVSDMIVTVRDGVTQAFYVDSVGFEELPDISKEIEELDSYVGAKIEWDGNSYEAIGTNGNRLILQSVNDDYHTEVTLAQLRLEEPELVGEKRVTVQTNMGEMPLADYRDIAAQRAGYDDYADMRKNGVMLGDGSDDPTMGTANVKPEYEVVELFGKEVLGSFSRVDRKDVPEGWFKYELRNVEGTLNKRLEYNVVMGFAGTVLSPERISIPEESGYRDVFLSDIHYTGNEVSIDEFMKYADTRSNDQRQQPEGEDEEELDM